MNYSKAFDFMKKKHFGQTRIGGGEYASHPQAVSEMLLNRGFPEKYAVCALFHDLLEDTDAKEEEIEALSDADVLIAVKLLTKSKGRPMHEYVCDISKNDMALTVKLADRIHNLKSAVLADDKFKRKYIDETELFYLPLSEGTNFEAEMLNSFENLKKSL